MGLVYFSNDVLSCTKTIKNLVNPEIAMSNTEKDKAAVEEAQDDDEPDDWWVEKTSMLLRGLSLTAAIGTSGSSALDALVG